MSEQEQIEITGTDSYLHSSNKNSADSAFTAVDGIQLKDQFTRDGSAPKARKPYTITKQRERWTEDEHKRFLEALKLYGRAWRKIEEHVGSKTAVQIRSHAQKFFSKVVRDSSIGDSSSEKPIEIPPPRPKRKPVHPYPRKLVSPLKNDVSVPENPAGSASLNLCLSEPENHSPTSVLSGVGSDASAGADSRMPSGNASPDSSALALNSVTALDSETINISAEEAKSPRGHEYETSNADEQVSQRTELSAHHKEDSKESSTSSFKLFGKTLLVKDTREQYYSTVGAPKPEPLGMIEEKYLLPWTVVPLKFPTMPDCGWNSFPSNSMNACGPVPLPWLTLCGGASLPTLEVQSPTPMKARPLCDKKGNLDMDDQKDGSSTGSNGDEEGGKSCEAESCAPARSPESKQKVGILFSSCKLSKRVSANSVDSRKGFVPYKRCLEENMTMASVETAEVREKQRIRLCL